MNQRDNRIDIFKGLLVVGMIFTHIMQFFSDTALFPMSSTFTQFFNIVTFSGFVFSFGYVSQLAYYRKTLQQAYRNMLITALKTLIAFYISGLYYRMFLDNRDLEWNLVKSIVLLEDIPGWSEFLVSFSLIMIVGIILFYPLGKLLENKILFWIVTIGLLFTTFIDYSSITIIQIGLLIGTTKFASFPVLQYFSFYLLGMYFAKYKIGWNWRILLGSIIATSVFVLYWFIAGELPSRFPPSIFWILSSCLFLYGYYLLAKWLDRLTINTNSLKFMGGNVLFYLLLSNILIFTIKKSQPSLLLSTFESFLFLIVMLLFISYLLRLKKS